MPTTDPSATIVVREHLGRPFYEAKFRYGGRQVKRRIEPAWLDRDPAIPLPGIVPGGSGGRR